MFNMGFGELVLLAVIGLLVLGPEQLPTVARKIARLINEFKRATEDVLNPVETAKRKVDEFIHRQAEDIQKPLQKPEPDFGHKDEPADLPKGKPNE